VPIFLFKISEIEKDDDGNEKLAENSPCFETKIEAQNNSNAIQLGIEKFLAENPHANLDDFEVSACSWK
jgi:hypothetical protein